MKTLRLLTWLMQFGISVAGPLVLCFFLSTLLQDRYHLGDWVIVAGVLAGLAGAVQGFRTSYRALRRESEAAEKDDPPRSFHDHR